MARQQRPRVSWRPTGNYPLVTSTCFCYHPWVSISDRNHPRGSTASQIRYTIYDFDREFPDDTACLEWLVGHLYPSGVSCPKCERVTPHYRVASRPCYACQFCGHHEYPMKGTIFENSATSLRLWFYGFFLMSQTRCGISAKQLERELGVTYKTAWRMFNKIRSVLADYVDSPLGGMVEADETDFAKSKRLGSPGKRDTSTERAVLGWSSVAGGWWPSASGPRRRWR
jgi:hypothetical protein